MNNSIFRQDIQGLRAVAVSLVLLYHAGVSPVSGGYVGVDVFFVISGFLITTHLLFSVQTTGTIDLADFYARRIRRIIPASFLVLAATAIASLVWLAPLRADHVVRMAIATALYVPNLALAMTGTNYLAEDDPSPFQQYWSLGIEEQFYLLWPLVLLLTWRWSRSLRVTLATTIGLAVVSLAACIWFTDFRPHWAFFSLPTRAWELGVGGIVAVAVARGWRAPGPAKYLGAVIGLAAILASGHFFDERTTFPGYAALAPVLGTALVIFCGTGAAMRGPFAPLASAPAQWIGKLSYSLYLWHWPLLVIPAALFPLPSWARLALIAAAVPLAFWTYRHVEEPMRHGWPKLRPIRVVAATAGASLVLIAAFSGMLALSNSRVLHEERRAEQFAASRAPLATPFVPSNLTPSLRSVDADSPVLYRNGCHNDQRDASVKNCAFGQVNSPKTIALFGDSHAAQWFPALQQFATQAGYRLEVYTKSACPSINVEVFNGRSRYRNCDTWRAAVIQKLQSTKPAAIIIANHSRRGEDSNTWISGLTQTVNSMPSDSAAIVIADTPTNEKTPATCLSASLNNTATCAIARSRGLDLSLVQQERKAAIAAGAAYVDMNDYLCTSDTCPPILQNVLVYRDKHHLTTSFSQQMARPLGEEIERAISDDQAHATEQQN